jgi:hypothetical protein
VRVIMEEPLPAGAQQAAEVPGANANVSVGQLVRMLLPSMQQQPPQRDLEAGGEPVAAVEAADVRPPAEAIPTLEARIEQLRPVLEDAVNALPFLSILLVHFFSFHLLGILSIIWFSMLLHRMNATLQAASAQPASVRTGMLLVRMSIFGFNVLLAEVLLASDGVWRCWWRIPLPTIGPALTLPNLLWLVVHNQYLLVFSFVAVKTAFFCSVSSVWSERRIKESLGLIESICAAWLQLLPAILWMQYLYDDRFVGSVQPFVIVYATIKLRACRTHFQRLRSAFTAAVLRKCPFGQYVQASECADRECAICLDSLNVPLKLPCEHIFCESCLMTWVQREATCPCCRAVVPGADGGGVPTNDGSSSLVPQLF